MAKDKPIPQKWTFTPAQVQAIRKHQTALLLGLERSIERAKIQAEEQFNGFVKGMLAAQGLLEDGLQWSLSEDCTTATQTPVTPLPPPPKVKLPVVRKVSDKPNSSPTGSDVVS